MKPNKRRRRYHIHLLKEKKHLKDAPISLSAISPKTPISIPDDHRWWPSPLSQKLDYPGLPILRKLLLMAERACVKRLQKEYHALCKEPVPQVVARPSPSNILEWHYVLEGSQGTPFEGGCYYGKIIFPAEYPFKPPSISMTTPNGRFRPHTKICLSISDFHPESWNPMWSVSSILTGLLSFMMDNGPTAGSIKTSADEKRRMAKASLAYNCESKNCPSFRKLFPEYVEKLNQQRVPEQTVSPAAAEQPPRIVEENKVVDNADPKRRRARKQAPIWQLVVLVSVVGFVLALPLFQL